MADRFNVMGGGYFSSLNSVPTANYTPLGGYGRPLMQSAPMSTWTANRYQPQTAGAYTSLAHYFMPTGEKSFNFGPGDYYTDKMRQHPAIIDARSSIQDQLAVACQESSASSASGKVPYSIGSRSFFGQIFDGVSTLLGTLTGGWFGSDPDYSTVGSFNSRSSWNTNWVDCNAGVADVNFSISNNMGLSSNTRFSYDGSRPQTSIFGNDPFGSTGALGTVYQNWQWNEPISFDPNLSCPVSPDMN